MLGPQGGTLIFSYIRRLGPFFGVQNFEFQYLFFYLFIFFLLFFFHFFFFFFFFLGGGVRKMNIFGGTKILWIFFGSHHKIGLHLGVISMHCRVFS